VTDTGSGSSAQQAQTNPGPAIDPGCAQAPQSAPQTQTVYVQQPAEDHFWRDLWMYHMLFGSPSTTTVVRQYAPAPANVQAPSQYAFAPAPAYAQQPQNVINNVTNNITQGSPETKAAPVTKSPNYAASAYPTSGYGSTSMKASTTTYKAAPAAATASVTPSYTTPSATSYSGSYSSSSSSSRSSYSSPSYSSYSSRSSFSSGGRR